MNRVFHLLRSSVLTLPPLRGEGRVGGAVRSQHSCLFLAALLLFASTTSSTIAQPAPKFSPDQIKFFEQDVVPILKANCWKCHGAEEKIKGELLLTSREDILKSPAVSLDMPLNSHLLKAIGYGDEKLKMPPTGKLTDIDIAILTKWVTDGLPWSPNVVVARKGPEIQGGKVTEEAKKYWAYQPIKRSAVPDVRNKAWVKSPIDAFILAKLEGKGLVPAKPADRVSMIRRVTYDLTGLPPTPEEVDSFVKEYNAKPQAAYEALIDRLLASQHYGEKWGRHWLDLVRYAETNGYERDGPKPHVWRYRDYVIRSFNNDKPYDRFIKEQIAGDEIDRNDADCVIATGFYRLGIWDDEPADREQARYDELDDIVATTSQVFLGMTMNCARCHDHKIDPIPQKDYYSMLSFFRDIPRFDLNQDTRRSVAYTDVSLPEARVRYEKQLMEREARQSELKVAMTKIEDAAIKKMPAEDQRATEGPDREAVLKKRLKQFLAPTDNKEYLKLKIESESLAKIADPERVLALSVNHCLVNPPETTVMIRGNPHSPGAKVAPAFPQVLTSKSAVIPPPTKNARTSGRRTILADWIASKDNPMTARVIVNRIWQHHFGRGIVATTNDFGKFGDKPTHPELLDWLATEFMSDNWQFKKLHKTIMLSAAYQMSSRADDFNPQSQIQNPKLADPGNDLLWRFNMRRLLAEEVRDSMLAVSGRLNLTMNGPSIYPKIPKEVLAGQSVPGQGWRTSSPEEAARRTAGADSDSVRSGRH